MNQKELILLLMESLLTEKEKKAISEFIKADKEKVAKQKTRRARIASNRKRTSA